MPRRLSLFALALVLCLGRPLDAAAQVFGTFTWQMQPYCNRVTLTLTTTASGFAVDGIDDQCGTSRGSAFGGAVFTPTGTVALNFTIVPAPSGKGVSVSAIVDPGTGSGTWVDSAGNSGTFMMGAATGGSPRPAPAVAGIAAGSITATELAAGAVTAAKVDSSQVQLRVSGTCPAGQLVTGVNANGTVACSAPTTTIAAGAIGPTELANGAVTAAKVNSSQVQLRVSGTCASGQIITGVNADGTVTCASTTAALSCTNTSVASNTIAAGTVNFYNNPACPATYTAVTPYCWTASAGVYSQGSGYNANAAGNSTFCSWQNTTGASQTVFGGNVCCRVP